MSRLNELIAELCPDGVEYRALGELGAFYGGLSGKNKYDFIDGNASFITYMNVYKNAAVDVDVIGRVSVADGEKQHVVNYGDVLFTGSSETLNECGMSSVVTTRTDGTLYLNSFCFGYRFHEPDMFMPDFCKHLFRSTELRHQIIHTAQGVTRFNVSKKKMGCVKIPVPPLEVQREIVRILDKFTSLTAELTAELTARRKQYAYYRDKLLTFGDDVPRKRLDEVLKLRNGKDYRHLNSGNIPVYGSGGIMTYVDAYTYDKPSVLIPRKGSLHKLYYVDVPFWNVDTVFYSEIFTDIIDPKFIYYVLQREHLERLNIAGAVPSLTQTMLNKILVPVPTLDEQKHIADILDRFDRLTNSITQGIPAEIAARKKQYSYYRDKLLSFPPLNINTSQTS